MHCYKLSISSTQFRIKINLPDGNWDSWFWKVSFCRLLELQWKALARGFSQFHTAPRLAVLWRAVFLYLFAVVLGLNKCHIFLLLCLKERKYEVSYLMFLRLLQKYHHMLPIKMLSNWEVHLLEALPFPGTSMLLPLYTTFFLLVHSICPSGSYLVSKVCCDWFAHWN